MRRRVTVQDRPRLRIRPSLGTSRRRRLQLESLEQRQMLTTIVQVTDAPSASTFCSVQDVSDDGSRVVMLSNQNIDDGNPDGHLQVLLQDRSAGTITQLTAHAGGGSSNAASYVGGSLSSDGSQVVFSSTGESLPGNNPDGSLEVYLYSTSTAQYVQLTESDSADSAQPVISGDGQWVAFSSTADLTGSNDDGNREIFRVHTVTLAIQQITNTTSGQSELPAIDADGSRIAFQSTADLTGDNSDGNSEIFLYDAQTDSISQVSSSDTGASSFASLDDSGVWLAFASDAALVTDSTDTEIMLYEVQSGTLQQISQDVASVRMAPRLSANGQRVSYVGATPWVALTITVHDIPTGADYAVVETASNFTPMTILLLITRNATAAPMNAAGSEVAYSFPDDPTGANADGGLEVFAATAFEAKLIDDAIFSVAENSPAGTLVGQMQPVDPGTQLQYSISNDESNGLFAIDSTTGELTVQSVGGLDHELQSEFALTIKAVSVSEPEIFDFASVLIEVADVNEPPVLVQPVDDQVAYAQASWDFTVPSGTFADPDAGDRLTYSAAQEDGTPLPAWLVFDDSTLTFTGTPSPSDIGDVIVVLTAHDSGDPSLSTDDHFKISVGENATPWQNPWNRYDVNAKDGVTPQDALIVINQLNRTGAGELPGSGLVAPPYYDVSGNNYLEPLDALQVINYLNRQLNDPGEGELDGQAPVVTLDVEAIDLLPAMEAVAMQPRAGTPDTAGSPATPTTQDAATETTAEICPGPCPATAAATRDDVLRTNTVADLLDGEADDLLAMIAQDQTM